MKVNNLPENLKEYIVARLVGNELWFWGTWGNFDEAVLAAEEVNGTVVNKGALESVR